MKDFSNWQKVELANATVDFYRTEGFLGFNSCECVPPEPMINARVGLNALRAGERLVMQNHRNPLGLLPSVAPFFDIQTSEENGIFELIFTRKEGVSAPKFDESAKDHG